MEMDILFYLVVNFCIVCPWCIWIEALFFCDDQYIIGLTVWPNLINWFPCSMLQCDAPNLKTKTILKYLKLNSLSDSLILHDIMTDSLILHDIIIEISPDTESWREMVMQPNITKYRVQYILKQLTVGNHIAQARCHAWSGSSSPFLPASPQAF